MVALLLAQSPGHQGLAPVPQGPSSPPQEQAVPQDPVCHDYHLKMHDFEIGSREFLMNRNKRLDFKCGAFHGSNPNK